MMRLATLALLAAATKGEPALTVARAVTRPYGERYVTIGEVRNASRTHTAYVIEVWVPSGEHAPVRPTVLEPGQRGGFHLYTDGEPDMREAWVMALMLQTHDDQGTVAVEAQLLGR